jgi:hypothetical protein
MHASKRAGRASGIGASIACARPYNARTAMSHDKSNEQGRQNDD